SHQVPWFAVHRKRSIIRDTDFAKARLGLNVPFMTAKQKVKIGLALIAAAASVIVGYWQYGRPGPSVPKEIVSYTGRVLVDSANPKPIHNAKVSIDIGTQAPDIEYTDSEGIFHLTTQMSITSIRIRVDALGFDPYDRNVTVLKGQIEDIRLSPRSTPPSSPTRHKALLPSGSGALDTLPAVNSNEKVLVVKRK